MSRRLVLVITTVVALACGLGCIEIRDMVEAATATPSPVIVTQAAGNDAADTPNDSMSNSDATSGDTNIDNTTDGDTTNDTGNNDSSAGDSSDPNFMPVDGQVPSPTSANSQDNTADDTTDDTQTDGIPPLPDNAVLSQSGTGLEFYDFETGSGPMPEAAARVRVAYTGYLPDGTIFDSSNDATFGLSNLIAGFAEGVQGMSVGGSRRLIIPPDLGYGASGNPGAGIGGEDTIVFDVDLLEIVGS